MVADGGAALTLEGGALTVTAGSAVVARGASKASLRKCTVQNARLSHVQVAEDRVAALEARSRGTIDATALDVGAGATGVAARGRGSTAAMRGCHFKDLSTSGVLARGGGTVTAGLAPEVAGGRVQASDPAAAQGAECAVLKLAASLPCTAARCRFGFAAHGIDTTLRSVRCSAERCKRLGVLVDGGAHAGLRGCLLNRSQETHGLAVTNAGSSVTGEGCTADGNACCGMYVGDAAFAELRECKFHGSREFHGLTVQGLGSSVTAKDCTADGNVCCGMYVGDGASAELRECMLQGSREFHGLLVMGAGLSVTAEGCTADGNARCGMYNAASA
jgi:Right handed beta helix region